MPEEMTGGFISCLIIRKLKDIARRLGVKKLYYHIARPFSHRKAVIDVSMARMTLEKFSVCPKGRCDTVNQVIEPFLYDLQIVVPVYNAEKYLKECMDSILQQETSYTYKVVLVDDGSTDSSGQIADQYLIDNRVQVIHQENKGFSSARNTGMNVIFAKFIMFVDSDDKLADNAIEALMSMAIKNDAMIVEGNFYKLYGENLVTYNRYKKREMFRNPSEKLTGFPWGKVFRSNIFINLCFPEGFWYEDSILAFLVYPQIESIWVIPEKVYIYRQHDQSISHTSGRNPKCIDSFWITEYLLQEYDRYKLPKNNTYYKNTMQQIMLNEKRIKHMPPEVQQSVFILSCLLYDKYLYDIHISDKNLNGLISAIRDKDFAQYCLYCETH